MNHPVVEVAPRCLICRVELALDERLSQPKSLTLRCTRCAFLLSVPANRHILNSTLTRDQVYGSLRTIRDELNQRATDALRPLNQMRIDVLHEVLAAMGLVEVCEVCLKPFLTGDNRDVGAERCAGHAMYVPSHPIIIITLNEVERRTTRTNFP